MSNALPEYDFSQTAKRQPTTPQGGWSREPIALGSDTQEPAQALPEVVLGRLD